jgi:CheY-like chemotaxis protein
MRKLRVLIVEDETIIAWDLKRTLEALENEVLPIAAAAERAVELARENAPDLILMDVILKGEKSGIDAAREIRTFSQKPIVFLTGNTPILNDSLLRETQAQGVFGKPTSERQLQEMLKTARRADASSARP